MKKPRISGIVLALTLTFLYLPLFLLMVNSFNASRFSTVWGGFSLKWYEKLIQDGALMRALGNSLLVALVSVSVSTLLGTLAGVVLARFKSRLQAAHRSLIALPLIMPDILLGISLLLLFIAAGVRLSLWTIIVGHITFSISYVASTVQARFDDFDFQLVEAARDLGAGRWMILTRVYLPLLAPGIVSGALLALTLSLDDFVISFFTAGPGASTLPIRIYSMIRFGTPPVINALSTLMIAFTFLLILIFQRFSRRKTL